MAQQMNYLFQHNCKRWYVFFFILYEFRFIYDL